MIQKAATFLKEVRSELSQVSWATPQELWESTKVVLTTVVLLAVIIGIFDFIFAQLMNWVLH